ncbi:MAG: WecB/TagA/CpsF family glycosyltransferase [Capsulimonadales bacterium]|nr:WecB/TagA/CpsF family glycosyltransferase [Capsulimonadales bacterium]
MKITHTMPEPDFSGNEIATVQVGDTDFHNVTMEESVRIIVEMATSGEKGQYVCTGNLDHLLLLESNELFRTIYANADLVVADGMPVVWLSRLNNESPLKERVAGSDLFWHLAEASAREGLKLFFLGGVPGSAQRAADEVVRRYPGAKICGIYCPPHKTFFDPEEQARIEARIREANPDVLLVGLGAPKQETWIYNNCHRLRVPVSIGVGGTFELASGVVRRAPKWAQKSGVEWLFRLAQDPQRLWRRYLVGDLPFLVRLTLRTLRTGRPRHSGKSGGSNSKARGPQPPTPAARVIATPADSWRDASVTQEPIATATGNPFDSQKPSSMNSLAR